MIMGNVHIGDIVQTYAYGQPYRMGEVVDIAYGKATVVFPTGGEAEVDCDFLAVIVSAE